MKFLLLLHCVLCLQLVSLDGADKKVIYPTLAEVLQNDTLGITRFRKVSGMLDWFVSERNGKISPHAGDIQGADRVLEFNQACVSPSNTTTLHFAHLDAGGRYVVKVVPNLPDVNVVAKVAGMKQAYLSLGLPTLSHLGGGNLREWHFIQFLGDNVFRVMIIKIEFELNGSAIKMLIGIGDVKPDIPSEELPPSTGVPPHADQ